MSRTCELTGAVAQSGNKVSHSNRKTRRKFSTNIQSVRLLSEALGERFKFRVNVAGLRTVEHNGGLDGYLLSTPETRLSAKAAEVRKKIKAKLAK